MNATKSKSHIYQSRACWPLHPFYTALYPILFLLANNIEELSLAQAIRPSILALIVTSFLLVLFGYSTRNFHQAAILVSLILILFYSYGHVFRLLKLYTPFLAHHILLGVLWLTLLFVGVKYKWKIRNTAAFTTTLNWISGGLLVIPLVTIGSYLWQSGGKNIKNESAVITNSFPPPPQTDMQRYPDIYYIILDGYGRSDILEEIYGYNNSEFINALENRGFFVATQSRSNYIQTSLSLASSLNLEYINYLQKDLPAGYRNRDLAAELIQHSKLRSFLELHHYETVSFMTGYAPTTISDANVFYSYDPGIISDLEGMILATSATSTLGSRINGLFRPFNCQMQRGGILNIFDGLVDVSKRPGQQFVFAHILAPHPPFVFGENGEERQFGECNGLDGSDFAGSREDYRVGYTQQAKFISKKIIETIDQILANSEIAPIIILQADHGPGLFLNRDQAEKSCLRERTAILNAYFLPGNETVPIAESITPVNTFRVVLNVYFQANLPLLEDKIYFSPWDSPYTFQDITHTIEASCAEYLKE